MSAFQTMMSILMLIYVLSVIVQAIQEIIKALFRTKAGVMEQIITKFMGEHLTLEQLQKALAVRGLKITDLESYNAASFRHLLDGISFEDKQLKGLVVKAQATVEDIKTHIAASYEAAREDFQAVYTRKNKLIVLATSYLVVIALNANIISLYDQVSVDSVVQQALVGQMQKIELPNPQQGDLKEVYSNSRKKVSDTLEQYPILIRSLKYKDDFTHPLKAVLGLLVMGALVSLGAPFWNDMLKSLAEANKTFGARRT